MPMRHRGRPAKNSSILARLTRLRITTAPSPSTPCTWNTDFAISRPIVITSPMDGSPQSGSLQRNHPMALRCRRVGAVHSIRSGYRPRPRPCLLWARTGLQCWLPRASALLAPGGEKSPEKAFFLGAAASRTSRSVARRRAGGACTVTLRVGKASQPAQFPSSLRPLAWLALGQIQPVWGKLTKQQLAVGQAAKPGTDMPSWRKITLAFMAVVAAAFSGHAVAQEKSIVVASTTSSEDSGLFEYLLPIFKEKTG